MQDLETRIKAERSVENSAFSSGFETLNKSLKAVFSLLVAVIAILLVWFFAFSGFFTVQPDTAVLTFQFGKFQQCVVGFFTVNALAMLLVFGGGALV